MAFSNITESWNIELDGISGHHTVQTAAPKNGKYWILTYPLWNPLKSDSSSPFHAINFFVPLSVLVPLSSIENPGRKNADC